jgi:predicted DNA-binding transcriptional regulator AlpA
MESKSTLERLLKPSELAEILGLKRSCIYNLLRSGQVPCIAVASGARKLSLRVRPSDLAKWLREREVNQ